MPLRSSIIIDILSTHLGRGIVDCCKEMTVHCIHVDGGTKHEKDLFDEKVSLSSLFDVVVASLLSVVGRAECVFVSMMR